MPDDLCPFDDAWLHRWQRDLDPIHTEVGFRTAPDGVEGPWRFTTVEGELVTGGGPLESSVTVSIDLNSIATGDENRDAHLRSADPRRGELPGDDMAVDARAPSLQHPA